MSGTSRYEIDIVANNKAAKALSKTNKQLQKIDKSAKKTNGALKNIGIAAAAAAVALGSMKLAKDFMKTATQFENLGVQLKFITGNAKLGAQALDVVEAAASRSAFAMEDMAAAAPSLLTVSSVDQLASTLDMAGDIAAATGMSFQEVSSQLQRAFSGGIAAADMFREKGVKSMLGFQEGVQYSAEETERMIREAFENGTTSMAGATAEMAKTWDGQMSMMGDAWMQFKKKTMDSGLFEALKDQLAGVRKFLEDNKVAVDKVAEALGEALATAVTKLGEAVAFTVRHFDFFLTVAKGLIALKLARMIWLVVPAMKALNIAMRANPIGFLIGAIASLIGYLSVKNGLGRTIVQVQAVLDVLGDALARFGNFLYEGLGKAVQWMRDRFYDFVDGMIDIYNWVARVIPGMKEFDKDARDLGDTLKEKVGKGLEWVKTKADDMTQAMLDALPDEIANTITAAAEAARLAGLEYDKLEEAAKLLAEQERLLAESLEYVDPIMKMAAEKTALLAEETKKLTEQQNKAKVAADEWAKTWATLESNLFPTQTKIAEIKATISLLNEKIAEGGPNTDRFREAIVKLQQQLIALNPETQKMLDKLTGYEDRILRIQRLERADAEAKLELTEAAKSLYDQMHPLEAQMERHNEQLELAKRAYEADIYTSKEFNKVQTEIQEAIKGTRKEMAGLTEAVNNTAAGFKDATEDMKTDTEKFIEDFNTDFNRKLADGLANGTLNFKTFAGMWKKMLADLIFDFLQGGDKLNNILSWLFDALGGGGKKGGFDWGQMLGGGPAGGPIPGAVYNPNPITGPVGMSIPLMAAGGTLGAGKHGIAGEAGPELITGPATVTPMTDLGSKPNVNVTIQAIDTQTGTEFLLKNKKQIEGIIQNAYNRRGKQGIY